MSGLDELNRVVGSIDANVKTLLERSTAHDKRLGAVEKRQWWLSGASTVVGFFASFFLKGHGV